MADDENSIELPLLFAGLEDVPVVLANHFAGQIDRDTFILTAGQVTPPMLIGTPEQLKQQAKQLTHVSVKVVGRFALSRDRLAELIAMLERQLAVLDEHKAQGEHDGT